MPPTPEQAARLKFASIPERPSVAMSKRTSELWDKYEIEANLHESGSEDYINAVHALTTLQEQIVGQVQPELPFLDDPGAVGSLTTTFHHDGSVTQRNSLGQARTIEPTEETRAAMQQEQERLDQPAYPDAAAAESATKIDTVIAAAKDGRAEAAELYLALSAKDQHEVTLRGGDEILDLLEKSVQTAGSRRTS